MVDVASITGYAPTNQKTAQSASDLSADMNTFLTLLTTQLQYQDPMDPMDTAEFTQQLVQYSAVEQSIQQNESLDELVLMGVANLGAQAVSYIGKTAQVLGDVMPLVDGNAMATYSLDKDVNSATILVKDMSGSIVYSTEGAATAGNHEFKWDGKDRSGVQLEDGAYQIHVTTAVPEGEVNAAVTTTVFGVVTGVASDDKSVYVGLGDAVTATLSDILTVRSSEYEISKNKASENSSVSDAGGLSQDVNVGESVLPSVEDTVEENVASSAVEGIEDAVANVSADTALDDAVQVI
ncbi:MAG: flagellar hook capping FlgD N-terminal domain-containing protein [Alphaproteobacteria bacterium]